MKDRQTTRLEKEKEFPRELQFVIDDTFNVCFSKSSFQSTKRFLFWMSPVTNNVGAGDFFDGKVIGEAVKDNARLDGCQAGFLVGKRVEFGEVLHIGSAVRVMRDVVPTASVFGSSWTNWQQIFAHTTNFDSLQSSLSSDSSPLSSLWCCKQGF
ncbi:hypothetical protein LOK49_LG01G01771 [Camellia lanceoleosa]|uniref:Uncharacterized protein n=1 Tax=Camellia lanceoleosa TaxID=1840588 RepID=A0ACC0IZV1_9ERIC|nr:hypothetical protein LOK49_LG01G01771 [Camellia lanceoleosa]